MAMAYEILLLLKFLWIAKILLCIPHQSKWSEWQKCVCLCAFMFLLMPFNKVRSENALLIFVKCTQNTLLVYSSNCSLKKRALQHQLLYYDDFQSILIKTSDQLHSSGQLWLRNIFLNYILKCFPIDRRYYFIHKWKMILCK